ncbi:MAG: helix-turn-helix domain-containing protein [Syntrophomonas sp.]|jgi:excisionase family DNA binding protein
MDKVYTPQQVAEILSITERTVLIWLRAGNLKGVKVGKYWRVMEKDLENFLEQNKADSTK